MLFPKIHRYNMFPPKCITPPCKNIEVTTVASAGTRARSVGSCIWLKSTAGITPRLKTARSPPACPSVDCHRNTRTQPTIKAIVMIGVIEIGLSSCSGITAGAHN